MHGKQAADSWRQMPKYCDDSGRNFSLNGADGVLRRLEPCRAPHFRETALRLKSKPEKRPCPTKTPKMVMTIPMIWTACGTMPIVSWISSAKTRTKLKKLDVLPGPRTAIPTFEKKEARTDPAVPVHSVAAKLSPVPPIAA